MKILIVEDDFASQQLLKRYLKDVGETVIAEDGGIALDVFQKSLDAGTPFDLVCLDIMLPTMDGQTVLKRIRSLEEERGVVGRSGVRILMLTALRDAKNVMEAFRHQAEGYLSKPIAKEKLIRELQDLGILGPETP